MVMIVSVVWLVFAPTTEREERRRRRRGGEEKKEEGGGGSATAEPCLDFYHNLLHHF